MLELLQGWKIAKHTDNMVMVNAAPKLRACRVKNSLIHHHFLSFFFFSPSYLHPSLFTAWESDTADDTLICLAFSVALNGWSAGGGG